jgi:peptidyl-prolyl cis-trans isomerase SurA
VKKSDKPKIDPFAPPPATDLEKATREQQDKPLGLNGDNSKVKKENPNDEGPKRRFSDEGRKKNSKPAPDPFAAPAPASGSKSTQQ